MSPISREYPGWEAQDLAGTKCRGATGNLQENYKEIDSGALAHIQEMQSCPKTSQNTPQ